VILSGNLPKHTKRRKGCLLACEPVDICSVNQLSHNISMLSAQHLYVMQCHWEASGYTRVCPIAHVPVCHAGVPTVFNRINTCAIALLKPTILLNYDTISSLRRILRRTPSIAVQGREGGVGSVAWRAWAAKPRVARVCPIRGPAVGAQIVMLVIGA
jgi:hypothetical protein